MTRAISGEKLGSRSQLEWIKKRTGGEKCRQQQETTLQRTFCIKESYEMEQLLKRATGQEYFEDEIQKYVFMTLKMLVKSKATNIKWALTAADNSTTFPQSVHCPTFLNN